jgi:hypothetical protein
MEVDKAGDLTLGGIVTVSELVAEKVTAGQFVTIESDGASTSGIAMICAEDEVFDGEECINADKNDEFSNGTSTFIKTKACGFIEKFSSQCLRFLQKIAQISFFGRSKDSLLFDLTVM